MKKLIGIMLILSMMLGDLCGFEVSVFAENESTSNGFIAAIDTPDADAIEISTAEELSSISNDLSGSYVLTADIELSGEWTPIGNNTTPFMGKLDGQGHKIYNLTNSLFDYIGENAIIKNIGLENINMDITASEYVGGIALHSIGIIENCYNTGKVSINHSYNDGSVYAYAGGIVTINSGIVSKCYNSSTISARVQSTYNKHASYDSIAYAGGISSKNYGTIIDCYNTNYIYVCSTGTNANYALSLYAYSGGITGLCSGGNIISCYNTGRVVASIDGYKSERQPTAYSGGIIGRNIKSPIANCYNTGDINSACSTNYTTKYEYSGGIVGENDDSTISSCYNIGKMVASSGSNYGHHFSGGITSYVSSDSVTNCYFDNLYGGNYGVQLELKQMKNSENFEGFDFDSVWGIGASRNDGYPYLKNLKNSLTCDISAANITVSKQYTYTGLPIIPDKEDIVVELDGETLVPDQEYSVSIENNINAGTAKIAVTGKNNYIGSAEGSFIIKKATSSIPNGIIAFSNQKLGDITLPTGWTWDEPLTTPVGEIGKQQHTASYMPSNSDNYNSISNAVISIIVAQDPFATPEPIPAPNDVTDLTSTAGDGQVALIWTTSDDADYYAIYNSDELIGAVNTNRYTAIGLTNGMEYSFTVKAVKTIDNSVYMSEGVTAIATPKETPAPIITVDDVSDLAAIPGDKQVVLDWTASDDADYYAIYNGDELIGAVDTNRYTAIGLTNGMEYSLTVKAVKIIDNGIYMSEGVIITATPEETPTPMITVNDVTDLTAMAEDGQVALSWTYSNDSDYYAIYSGSELIGAVDTNQYTAIGLINETEYSFTVKAVKLIDNSIYMSKGVTVTATPEETPVPIITVDDVSDLAATAGDKQVVLDWTTSDDAGYYAIYNDNELVGAVNTNRYTVTGLTNGTEYSFTVKAVKLINNSVYISEGVTVSTKPEIPEHIEDIDVSYTNGTANIRSSYDVLSAVLIFSAYDNNGVLQQLEFHEDISLIANEPVSINMEKSIEANDYVKVMLWSSLDDMIPLVDAVK